MQDVVGLDASLVEVAIRSAIIYVAVYTLFRFFGKRQIAQLNPADFIVLLLISNGVQNAMVGSDSSILGGLVAAVTLLGISLAIERLERRFRVLDSFLEGTEIELVRDGVILDDGLRRADLDLRDLQRALRKNGAQDASRVSLAMFETDGTVSVVMAEG
jgi:uncharacterized membrane protein YcaP (DUF421 family)